jgi:hypothetical protein
MSINGTLLRVDRTDSGSSSITAATTSMNAWDPENSTLRYSIVPSTVSSDDDEEEDVVELYPIGVLQVEGHLIVSGELDYEETSLYVFDVVVEDSGGLKDSTTMSVIVTDVNESPTFLNDSYIFYIAEDQQSRTNIGGEPCTATDLDEDQDLTYTMQVVSSDGSALVYNISDGSSSDGGQEMFDIVDCSGQLILLRPVDYEIQSEWYVEITVTDDDTISKSDKAMVTIIVEDVNEPPIFVRTQTTFSVAENSVDDLIIGRLIASDPENDDLAYTIVTSSDANDGVPFTVDLTTGAIKVDATTATLNYERKNVYTFTVSVSDVNKSPTGTDEMEITIQIDNVEEAPTFTAQTILDSSNLHVLEHASSGEEVGGSEFTAIDEDQEDSVRYTLVEESTPFIMNSLTGQLSIGRNFLLDYETTPTYFLTIQATDLSGLSVTHVAVVHVVDENDAPTLIRINSLLQVNENTANGVSVGAPLELVDVDKNQTFTFKLLTSSNYFTLDSNTGQLITSGDVMDYESMINEDVDDNEIPSKPIVTLRYMVEDSGTPSLSDETTISIEIIDINEPPSLLSETKIIQENSPAGTFIGRPLISIDTTTTAVLTRLLFNINSISGQLILTKNETNYEDVKDHIIWITVTDKGGLSTTSSVRIEIEDINEPPLIVSGAIAVDVSASAGAFVGQGATCVDLDFDQTITYRIVEPIDTSTTTTTSGLLEMSQHDGTVRVADGVSLGSTQRTFYIVVGCVDSGSPSLEVLTTVPVTLYDTNKPPIFLSTNNIIFDVMENSPINTNVGTPIVATDLNEEDVLTYSLLSETITSAITLNNSFSSKPILFNINPSSGQILLKSKLNHEETSEIMLLVEARDNGFGQLCVTKEVTIIVQDLNEKPNIPDRSSLVLYIQEDALPYTLIGTVITTDPDDDDSITYRLASPTDNLFTLSPSGDLSLSTTTTSNNNQKLNYETTNKYDLLIEAIDNGVPSLSTTYTATIYVLNTNDAPSIVGGQSFQVDENAPIGTIVGSPVQWNDEDGASATSDSTANRNEFSILRVGCFSIITPASSKPAVVETPDTMRPTFVNVSVRVHKSISEKAVISLRHTSKTYRITVGASGNTKTIIEKCIDHSSTNVVCSPVASSSTPNILKGSSNNNNGRPTWLLVELTNTTLSIYEKINHNYNHNPIVSSAYLKLLINVPLVKDRNPSCAIDSGTVFSLDAQCNDAEDPKEEWMGRRSIVGGATAIKTSSETVSGSSVDMKNTKYFEEEGGYYHFNKIIKNIPTTLNPSVYPELTLEVYFRMHRVTNNRGWLICSDDKRGGYDRGISIHDNRFNNRPSGICGKSYRSSLPKVKKGEWTHLVATFKNGKSSQICMTSGSSTKGQTICQSYVPNNLPVGEFWNFFYFLSKNKSKFS